MSKFVCRILKKSAGPATTTMNRQASHHRWTPSLPMSRQNPMAGSSIESGFRKHPRHENVVQALTPRCIPGRAIVAGRNRSKETGRTASARCILSNGTQTGTSKTGARFFLRRSKQSPDIMSRTRRANSHIGFRYRFSISAKICTSVCFLNQAVIYLTVPCNSGVYSPNYWT